MHAEDLEMLKQRQNAKDTAGKPDPTLVPPGIILAIERIRAYGTQKYKDRDNWKLVDPEDYWRATLRHAIAAWDDWRAVDPESGALHIAHMACNIAFLLEFYGMRETDDGDD